jgi:hypothetical protein
MLVGLEELALRCVDDESRAHIREAVKCYEGGAYRAAITSAYVAVCFDLIAKMRALAGAGDTEAQTLTQSLDNLQRKQDEGDKGAVRGLLNIEKTLLETFREKFEFFGTHEFEELDRLRTDRNRCAHPTFSIITSAFSPPPELARLHIRNAVELVLSQQPKQGKAAIAVLRDLVLSPYFPDKEPDAIERLRASDLASARPSLINAFLDEVAFGWPDVGGPYYKKLAAIHSIMAATVLHPNIAVPRLVKNVEKLLASADKDHVHFGGVVAIRAPVVGENCSDAAKVTVKAWLNNAETRSRTNAIKYALNVSWLKADAKKIAANLTSAELAKGTFRIPQELLDRSAQLFSEVKSWDSANKNASDHAVKWADRYTPENVETVVKGAVTKKVDLRGSGGFDRFLNTVAKENPLGLEGLNTILKKYDLDAITAADETGDEG